MKLILNPFAPGILLLISTMVTPLAHASVPTVGFVFENPEIRLTSTFLTLENGNDVREFIDGFGSEIAKARKENPKVKVLIHWFDAITGEINRGIASKDDAEGIAEEIVQNNSGIEVDGSKIQPPATPSSHSAQIQQYVSNANRAAFIIRVGVVGVVSTIHLFLTYNVPMWIPLAGGICTAALMYFNTVNTDKIVNLINYLKFKTLSDEEVRALKEKIENSSALVRGLQGPKVYFTSFLYEVAFQGTLQFFIQALLALNGSPLTFDVARSFTSIATGTVGEASFDLAQRSYQETRAGAVHPEIRRANLMLIGALSSTLGVPAVLASSDASVAGYISLGAMISTGLVLNFYYRYTNEIHDFLAPIFANEKLRGFLNGVSLIYEKVKKSNCNFLLKPKNEA